MCFSATASFTAAAGLSIVSLLSIKKAPTQKIIPLAISPLFFAAQQACEGIVWITLNAGDTTSILHMVGVYGFLFFAAFWWPFWIPIALYIPEKIHSRKKLLFAAILIGTLTGITMFISWVFYTTGAQSFNHHIDYPVPNYPFNIANKHTAQLLSWLISIGYCITTIITFFISSIKKMWLMGIAIGLGFVAAYLFYIMAFSSVWCFFAAISSLILYFIIRQSHQS
jgi:hypothetical protein